MMERVGRMISVEVGVTDEAAGNEIASLMMGESSPLPGSERGIGGGSVLSYLRSFEASEPSGQTRPVVWVDFGIRYDNNADADPIAGWLFGTLTKQRRLMALRVDTSEIPLEMGAMTKLIRSKLKKSL